MGAPGAGKSTYAKTLGNVVTNDRKVKVAPGEIIHEAYKRVHQELAAGRDVVLDATGANAAMRKGMLGIAQRYGAQTAVRVVDTPLADCLAAQKGRKQPVAEADVRRIHADLIKTVPNLAKEGFGDVRIVKRSK